MRSRPHGTARGAQTQRRRVPAARTDRWSIGAGASPGALPITGGAGRCVTNATNAGSTMLSTCQRPELRARHAKRWRWSGYGGGNRASADGSARRFAKRHGTARRRFVAGRWRTVLIARGLYVPATSLPAPLSRRSRAASAASPRTSEARRVDCAIAAKAPRQPNRSFAKAKTKTQRRGGGGGAMAATHRHARRSSGSSSAGGAAVRRYPRAQCWACLRARQLAHAEARFGALRALATDVAAHQISRCSWT
jgi:hypothetical protein